MTRTHSIPHLIAVAVVAAALALLVTRASAAAVPAAPSDAQYDAATHVLSWHDNSDDEDGFRVLYTIGPGSQPGILHTVPANTTSFTVPEPTDDGHRAAHFVVTAFNAAGESAAALAEWDSIPPSPPTAVAETPEGWPFSPPSADSPISPPQLSGPGSLPPSPPVSVSAPGGVSGPGNVSAPNTGTGRGSSSNWPAAAAGILFAAAAVTLAGALALLRPRRARE